MSVAMLKSLAFTFCTPDGESGIVVQKRGGGIKSLGIGLETDNRSIIGPRKMMWQLLSKDCSSVDVFTRMASV